MMCVERGSRAAAVRRGRCTRLERGRGVVRSQSTSRDKARPARDAPPHLQSNTCELVLPSPFGQRGQRRISKQVSVARAWVPVARVESPEGRRRNARAAAELGRLGVTANLSRSGHTRNG